MVVALIAGLPGEQTSVSHESNRVVGHLEWLQRRGDPVRPREIPAPADARAGDGESRPLPWIRERALEAASEWFRQVDATNAPFHTF